MNNKTKQLVKLIVFGLGLAASILLLLKAFKLGQDDGNLLEGSKIIFGGMKNDNFINFDFTFNIILFVALIAPVLGGLFAMSEKGKLSLLVSMGLFILSIVLLVTTKQTGYEISIGGASQTLNLDIALSPLGYVSIFLSAVATITSAGILLQD